jgi:RNA polymerase sigma-70 factor (ECF subfamily)
MSLPDTSRVFEQMQRVRQGDATALGPLLENYRGYLLVLAQMQLNQRLQSKVDAHDVVQETFLEGYRDFHQYQGSSEEELLGWLRRILATNLAENELDAGLHQSSACLGSVLAAPGSTPSEKVMRQEESVRLASALQELPEHYREVVLLRNLQGLSFIETAQRMGRSVDSVEKLWARALVKLRRLMEPPRENS